MVGRGAGGLWGGSARTRSSAASACACWQAACPTRARSSYWPCRATPRSTPRVRMAALAVVAVAAAAAAALPRRPEWGSARRSGWCCRSAPVTASSALGQRPWELQQAAEVPSGGRCRSRWAAARPAAQRLAPARRGSAAACSRPAPRAGRRRRYRWPALCSFLRGGTRGRVDESAQRVERRRARSRSRDVESRERPFPRDAVRATTTLVRSAISALPRRGLLRESPRTQAAASTPVQRLAASPICMSRKRQRSHTCGTKDATRHATYGSVY